MAVDFLEYNSCVWSPIVIGNTVVKRASEFKLLGIVISYDLTWDVHCAVILKKANKRLHALRQLKKSGVSEKDLVAVYCILIRSVIEYGCVVFANMTKRLCNALEKIQKRALSIIYPAISYDDALAKANLVSLECRRHDLCYKYINSLPEDHPVKKIIYARTVDIPQHYELRSNASRCLAPARTNRLSQFVSVKYLNV